MKFTKMCSTKCFENRTLLILTTRYFRGFCALIYMAVRFRLCKNYFSTIWKFCIIIYIAFKKSRTDSTNTRETNTRIAVSIYITQTKVQAYCRAEGTVCDRQWKLHFFYFWWWINDKRCKINWTRNICIEYTIENVGNKQGTRAECTPSLYLNTIKRDYIQITFSKTRVLREMIKWWIHSPRYALPVLPLETYRNHNVLWR